MALSDKTVPGLAAELIAEHSKDLEKNGRLGKVKRYLDGDHNLPYMPRGAQAEYKALAEKSITNWLPLVSDTFSKGLFVDGYRPAKTTVNAEPWNYWQVNGLDARQTIAHRGALDYGLGFAVVLPGPPTRPVIKPVSPLRTHALYEDEDDEWPYYVLLRKGNDRAGGQVFQVLDDRSLWTLVIPKGQDKPVFRSVEEHRLGVCPVTRFRDRLDGEARGIILPLLTLQDRINESVFSLLIALQYASFRQRWATGLVIPRDENPYLDENGNGTLAETGTPNPNFGQPIEPFEAAVNRLWVTDNHEAKFGDFAQTEVSGHLRTYESTVKTFAAIAQTSPLALLGDLVNLSADALAATEATTQRKIGEYETIFGETWEQTLRLAASADRKPEAASDTSAQVRWRDTEARSMAATVDALGKMAQMLMVPVEGLWERIPGVTDTDVQAWKALAKSSDSIKALAEALTASVERPTTGQGLTDEPPPASAA